MIPNPCPVPGCLHMMRLRSDHLCWSHYNKLGVLDRRILTNAYRRWSGCDDPRKVESREAGYNRVLKRVVNRVFGRGE